MPSPDIHLLPLAMSPVNQGADGRSISPATDYAHQINASREKGYLEGHQEGYLIGHRDGRLEAHDKAREEGHYQGHQEGLQEGYQLALSNILNDAQRHQENPPFRAAEPATAKNSMTARTTPSAAVNMEVDDPCDENRSDRSSSLEDIIPPAFWRPAKHTMPRVTDPSAPALTTPTVPEPAQINHGAPSHAIAEPIQLGHRATPLVAPERTQTDPRGISPATPEPTLTSLRATTRRAGPSGGRRVGAYISARRDPAWQAAMEVSGMKIGLTMGLYLDGQITVNGQYAITVPRQPPCERCNAAGRDCRVLDMAREKNLVSGICNFCIRHRRKCVT